MTDPTLFMALIKRRCGLSFEDNRRGLLDSALRQRVAATGSRSDTDYFVRLMADEAEFAELVSLLTINETYFFRERRQLTLMVERLAPRLLARTGRGRPVRILSAACSTGEEPYSIAMALRDGFGEAARHAFRVHGGDIDQQALARARVGRYGEFSFRGVEPEIKARHFQVDGAGHAPVAAVRELVEFMPMNLLDDRLPDMAGRYDIIFLRNVTIYFDTPTRREIQRRMRAMLEPDGYLLVGMAETLANDFGLMALIEEDGLFYFVQGETPGPSPAPLPDATVPDEPAAPPEPPATLEEAGRLTWERAYDQALAVLDALAPGDGADPRALALKAHILLNRKELAGAEAAARQALEREPWLIDAFLVLGLAARHAERPAEALEWFKRAAYASHGCWPAHYYLADLHRAAGDHEQARGAYQVALNLLSVETKFDSGLAVLLPAFPVADIGFLCRHQLSRLARPSAGG